LKFILSPTKTFDFTTPSFDLATTEPRFLKEALQVNENLLHIQDIAKAMKCSEKIASEVATYINSFNKEEKNRAIFSYSGAVFKNLEPGSLSVQELTFLHEHLTILSGMYGALKPFDAISKYRLEMQQKFPHHNMGTLDNGLYSYWKNKISDYLLSNMSDDEVLINLASNEYFKVIGKKLIKNIVTVEFKENKAGVFKVVGTYAKMARGKMLRFIAQNSVDSLDELKRFNIDGYSYNEELSTLSKIIFTR